MSKGSRHQADSDDMALTERSLVEELEGVIRRHAANGVDVNGRAFELRSGDPDAADWEVSITKLAK